MTGSRAGDIPGATIFASQPSGRRYCTLLEKSDHFELASISAAIGTRAAQIRADFGFRTPDALQLATAVVRDCDIFLTNDQQLMQYDHVETVLVSDMEPRG